MNNCLVIFFLSFLLVGCGRSGSQDNLDQVATESLARSQVKIKATFLDTTGQGSSPIRIVSSGIGLNGKPGSRRIAVRFKNVSDKNISALRFEWYAEDFHGNPADMGDYLGQGSGTTEESLKSGDYSEAEWEISSVNADSLISIRAYQVFFDDDTSWELSVKR